MVVGMEQERVEGFPPLPGRDGQVGGIESLTLDGRRLYFGFDYGGDIVLSPLIGDPDAMAAFASAHMRQTTGAHDAAYWADAVAVAAESSALAEDADRDFTSAGLRGELPVPGGHLLYLLGAATEWDDWFAESPQARRACERLGLDTEDPEFIDPCLDAVREHGTRARPDEWTVVRFHLGAAIRHLPGNWETLFAPLAQCVARHA